MPDALFELPAVAGARARVQLLELRPGRLELRGGAGVVDLLHVDRVVDERERPVGFDLEEPRAGGKSVAPWVLVGAGGAMLVAGTITGIVALGKTSSIASACPQDTCPSTFDLDGARSSARTFVGLTDVLLIAGGVVAAGGLTWGLLSGGTSSQGKPRISAVCGVTGT